MYASSSIEAKNNRFVVYSLVFGDLMIFAVACLFSVFGSLVYAASTGGGVAFALIVGAIGLALPFVLRKNFFLKLLCCGAGIGSLLVIAQLNGIFYNLGIGNIGSNYYSGHYAGANPAMWNPLLFILLFGAIIVSSVALSLFVLKSDLPKKLWGKTKKCVKIQT